MASDELPVSPYTTILCCTDFSENAARAFTFALDAAVRRPGSVLHLLHVIPEPEAQFWKTYVYNVEGVDEKARSAIDQIIERDYRPHVPDSVSLEVVMRIGKDYLQILEYAGEIRADLIVLGRHGHSALENVLFGNVTEKVVRKAACPVLVVPRASAKTGDRAG
ncbi:MAG TPA: universal stress protein, partial [Candidatus Hydrogenedentes bacterium]|nr:universal stress protein [Candidatus Hydrogenedentota bacterium]